MSPKKFIWFGKNMKNWNSSYYSFSDFSFNLPVSVLPIPFILHIVVVVVDRYRYRKKEMNNKIICILIFALLAIAFTSAQGNWCSTNCKTPCVGDSGVCCGGDVADQETGEKSMICETYCLPKGYTCCGCNYQGGIWTCGGCPQGSSCKLMNSTIPSPTIQMGGYYCERSSFEKLLPSIILSISLVLLAIILQ
ncbi:hypothetical protein DFA_07662 [Cavenderia fasciculata]|uniref:Uncharacterized protein n=1 Tax=Cavenderia fasciculata TaxID=261658 RepID=F4Q2K5_CACFS|nr:uncharacterized protein DFA_07662 [Cavenderia fasciculata]EGG16684.1 hypothetical protein DFA_07662 [Cavenderia fasciculata]|eukprot:XP_004355158.1 hypothetical protein DFA_07662 [Cavenderia fasciculata]